jgi:hypothetical protein
MLCSANAHEPAFAAGKGCNANISVTLSNGAFGASPQITQNVSPKKTSFIDNLMRRNSPKPHKKEKPKSQFFKKSQELPVETRVEQQMDQATADLIEQLLQEGRSEQDISMHLSYINDVHTVSQLPASPRTKGGKHFVARFLKDVQQAFKENFGPLEPYVVPAYDIFEDDLHRLNVGVSSAPFFGALPYDPEMSYEELVNLEPVYIGSQCVNNLPQCIHDGTALPGDQTKCPVCLEDFTEGECLKSLPCVHFYHKDCIDSWLMVGHNCPVCKFLVE